MSTRTVAHVPRKGANVWMRVRSHFTGVVTLAHLAMMLTDGFDEIKVDAK